MHVHGTADRGQQQELPIAEKFSVIERRRLIANQGKPVLTILTFWSEAAYWLARLGIQQGAPCVSYSSIAAAVPPKYHPDRVIDHPEFGRVYIAHCVELTLFGCHPVQPCRF
ncbi:hypothetical protein D3C77_529950 [compost metagenome]